MHVILPYLNNTKGVAVLSHVEGSSIGGLEEEAGVNLSDFFHLYGHYAHLPHIYPHRRVLPPINFTTYFTESFFRPTEDIKEKAIEIIESLKPSNHINTADQRFFDFISAGRCHPSKGCEEILDLMIMAATEHDQQSCLLLIKDPSFADYFTQLISTYNDQPKEIKSKILFISDFPPNSQYCIQESLPLEHLSLLLNSSKVYIHNNKGDDEARVIGQALLSNCIIHINKRLSGHSAARRHTSQFTECDSILNRDKIKESLHKSKNYSPNDYISQTYDEKNTVPAQLKDIYEQCAYNKHFSFKEFFSLCDAEYWSLKLAGHWDDVPWNIVKKDEPLKYNNPTHHIQGMDQFKIFLKHQHIIT